MPFKPGRPCRQPGCPAVTNDRTGYCDRHRPGYQKETAQRRDQSKQQYYNYHWARIRKLYLNTHPICAECQKEGRVVVATLVHHIDEDPSHNEESNLMALCNDCHERKHKATRFGNDKRIS